MKRKLFALLTAAALMAACASCSSQPPVGGSSGSGSAAGSSSGSGSAGEDKMVVAFSQMEMNNAWRVAETESIQAEAEKRGIELIYTDAQGDTAKQVSDVEDIIAKNPDVIMLAPREYEGLAPALAAAKEAGIPVLLIDRDAKREIEELIQKIALEGISVLLISSEFDELIRNCHRVEVIRDGRNVHTLRGEAITEANIMQAIAQSTAKEESV